jgi:hypothetical protein
MKNTIYSSLLCCVLLSVSISGESGLVVHGSLQTDASAWYQKNDKIDSAVSFAGINMLTLEVKTSQLKQAKVEGMLDIYQLYGKNAEYFYAALPQSIASSTGDTPIMIDLRTLYGAFYLPWADVTVGRQIVNYGKGMLFSPLDAFSTVNLLELSFRRSGSDIAMAAIPVGDLSGVDIVTEFPIEDRDYASAVRGFTTFGGWDLSAVGIYRHRTREVTGGIAFKGDLEVGVTGEFVTHYDHNNSDIRFEAMTGIDYSIHNTIFFSTEYWYRSDKEPSVFYGEHNLFGSVQYIINDLMSVSAVIISALPEEHVLATFQYQYNILQSVDTQWFLRYYHLENLGSMVPEGEAGVRAVISF